MLIYDKKENSIDIYTLEKKEEEIKKYKKNVIQRNKNNIDFNILSTNNTNTIRSFIERSIISWDDINYDNNRGIYSQLSIMQPDEKMNEILDRYINGEFDKNHITTVAKDLFKGQISNLLNTEHGTWYNLCSDNENYELPYLIELPYNLYLLHLLKQGRFVELIPENIKNQLNLFDIEYIKNVKLSDIQDMIDTGLVYGDIDSIIDRAETGSKILKKLKR